MTGNKTAAARITALLFALFLAAAAFTAASADDEALQKELPGKWSVTDTTEKEGETPQEVTMTLTLEEDGKLLLQAGSEDGGFAWTWEGTWTFHLGNDGMDRITLLYTSTDYPAHAGEAYRAECIYYVYAESWVENDTGYTALIFDDMGGEHGVTPFEEVFGYDGAAMYRIQPPNMRTVNCSNYVSLREKRSKTSARLAKVPLGAPVLAFPEAGNENGFILCVYHNEYGYILSEYLEPVE